MAGEKTTVAAGDPLAGIANLLQTLGGAKTAVSAGDTSVLNSAVSGLQGLDPAALLTSIFQQAAGQIPGIQQAFANSMGARTGGNSAVQQALSSLLQQTTLAGQKQVMDQQLAALQQQVQAGSQIAAATKGTSQTQGTNMGQAGMMLAALQLASKTGLLEKVGLGKNATAGGGTAVADVNNNPYAIANAGPVFTASPVTSSGANITSAAPQFNLMDFVQQPQADWTPDFQADPGFGIDSIDFTPITQPSFDINELLGTEQNFTPIDFGDEQFNLMDYL